MKPVYFLIICMAVAHPNKGIIIKLRIKKRVYQYIHLSENSVNGAILAKAFSFPPAFLCISEM